jgi:hypothetical protein
MATALTGSGEETATTAAVVQFRMAVLQQMVQNNKGKMVYSALTVYNALAHTT